LAGYQIYPSELIACINDVFTLDQYTNNKTSASAMDKNLIIACRTEVD